jgi:hypothetical protein
MMRNSDVLDLGTLNSAQVDAPPSRGRQAHLLMRGCVAQL